MSTTHFTIHVKLGLPAGRLKLSDGCQLVLNKTGGGKMGGRMGQAGQTRRATGRVPLASASQLSQPPVGHLLGLQRKNGSSPQAKDTKTPAPRCCRVRRPQMSRRRPLGTTPVAPPESRGDPTLRDPASVHGHCGGHSHPGQPQRGPAEVGRWGWGHREGDADCAEVHAICSDDRM